MNVTQLSLYDSQTIGAPRPVILLWTPNQKKAFWTHVTCGINPNDCWTWSGDLNNHGYGVHRVFWNGRANRKSRRVMAHRASYLLSGLLLLEGQELDHLCRNRVCVNPLHLEPVNHRTNILRGNTPMALNAIKTHCPQSHEYNQVNTYVRANGSRQCRTCARLQKAAARS